MQDSQLDWLQDSHNAGSIRNGLRGIEKECLRVDRQGLLSRRTHPAALGSTLTHPYLTTDYSEAQLEFVTPPYPTNWETFQFLCDIHSFVCRNLDDELLWAPSMPCIVNPSQDLPIAVYGNSNVGRMKSVYREGLGFRYGRAMQAISGVHFNFSMPAGFWELYRASENERGNLQSFVSDRYMGLVRNYRRLAWLVIYLFGASPALCKSFRPDGHETLAEFDASTWFGPYSTSLRMSDIGYRNKSQSRIKISANSLDEYTAALGSAITTSSRDYEDIGVRVNGKYRQLNTNLLQIENEYYSSIRPKPAVGGKEPPTVRLLKGGVDYVEVRTLDLNMHDPVGVNQTQFRFLEALLIYCLLTDSPPIDSNEQAEIDARDLIVAREGRRPGLTFPHGGSSLALRERGLAVLENVAVVAEALDADNEGYVGAVDVQREALVDSDATPSARLLADMRDKGLSFVDYGLAATIAHTEYLRSLPLSADKLAFFERTAAESLQRADEIERSDDIPFEAFLEAYFGQIKVSRSADL
ncbi:MAG TPA: glutamate--cysteine ligase [Gammaproteobacteria bacterium]